MAFSVKHIKFTIERRDLRGALYFDSRYVRGCDLVVLLKGVPVAGAFVDGGSWRVYHMVLDPFGGLVFEWLDRLFDSLDAVEAFFMLGETCHHSVVHNCYDGLHGQGVVAKRFRKKYARRIRRQLAKKFIGGAE